MRISPIFSFVLAGALLVATGFIGTNTAARQPGEDQAGDFDFYVMAFSIAPSFCILTGNRKHKRQCEQPDDDAFVQNVLTVHGLWPNKRNRPAGRQPQSCSAEPLPNFPEDLLQQLNVYMPGIVDDLADYEWSKHGVCSGLSAEDYFRRIVEFAQRANATIGAVLKDNGFLGQQLSIRDFLLAVGRSNQELSEAIVVDCKFSRKRRGERTDDDRASAYVSEIRILIDRDISAAPDGNSWPGRFVSRASVAYRANSGCPNGSGFLPAGFEQQPSR